MLGNDKRSILAIDRCANIPRHTGLRYGVGGGTLIGLITFAQETGGVARRVPSEEVNQLERERSKDRVNRTCFAREVKPERGSANRSCFR